jgi:hypothetical protein
LKIFFDEKMPTLFFTNILGLKYKNLEQKLILLIIGCSVIEFSNSYREYTQEFFKFNSAKGYLVKSYFIEETLP